jgi:hypothetical protein
MKKLTLLLVALLFSAASAFAFQCPKLMKQFDEKVGSSKASAQQIADAKKLRSEGESLHKAGKHQESVDALNKALKMIGAM